MEFAIYKQIKRDVPIVPSFEMPVLNPLSAGGYSVLSFTSPHLRGICAT
jgi:hypothetical protein